MSSFTVESILDTNEPGVIEMLGSAPGVSHNVSGTLHLHVQKTVQLKQLSVSFDGEALVKYDSFAVSTQSDPIHLYKTQFHAIDSPTTYPPGDYSFPFQLSIPSDLAATESTKLSSHLLLWGYDLVTNAIPATSGNRVSSLFQKRKVAHQALTLRKVMVEPSMGEPFRYGAKRDGEFETSIWVPKIVSINQCRIPLSVLLRSLGGEAYRVKEVNVVALQMEKILFDSKEAYEDLSGVRRMIPNQIETDPMARNKYKDAIKAMVDTFNTKVISRPVTFTPTHQHGLLPKDVSESVADTGAAKVEEFEMELLLKEILPTETLPWVQISHAIKFSIVFVDATKKSLVVKAPFTLGHILNVRDLPSSTWVFDVDGQNSTAGVPLPGYGADMGQSTLLDSNTRPRGGGRSGETDGMELPPTYVSDGVVPPLAEK